MTKQDLNARLATPLSPAKLKKTSLADLQAMVDAQKPKARRLADRVLFPCKPELKLPRVGTRRHLLVFALDLGTTFEEMQKVTGWSRDSVSSAIYTDVRDGIGLGVERRDGRLYLIKPSNLKITKDEIVLVDAPETTVND